MTDRALIHVIGRRLAFVGARGPGLQPLRDRIADVDMVICLARGSGDGSPVLIVDKAGPQPDVALSFNMKATWPGGAG